MVKNNTEYIKEEHKVVLSRDVKFQEKLRECEEKVKFQLRDIKSEKEDKDSEIHHQEKEDEENENEIRSRKEESSDEKMRKWNF